MKTRSWLFALVLSCLALGSLATGAHAAATPERAAVQQTIESGADLSSRAQQVLYRARTRLDNDDPAGAVDAVSDWLKGTPDHDHPLLRFTRAEARLYLDQPDSAWVDLRRAVDLEPRFARAWLKLGELAYSREEYALAAEAFGRGYELSPDAPTALLHYRGVCLLLADRPDEAVTVLAGLLQDHRDVAELEWYRALVAADLECAAPGRATPLLDHLVEDFAAEPDAWDLAARHAAARRDYRGAVVALTIVDYLQPLVRVRLRQLGDLYAACGVPLQAARCYRRALEGEPRAVEADSTDIRRRRASVERLAAAWLEAHRPGEARAVLQAELAADPGFGRGYLLLGYAALDLDRTELARDSWRKALAHPDQADEAGRLLQSLGAP
ncbi:hypothetical protein CO151_02050 [bacterium CG_4_9_14_3_um_filter_65_15]|nr:MAG: hypothetical protein CO151_02050 [bacterium CG_4_9_14_3_um_filter_65_15]